MGTVNVVLGEDTRLNLILGQQLENAVTSVVFDFSAWQTTYGSGTLALSVQRPGDDQPYAVALTTSGTDATWSVTSLDTAYKGVGHIQLTYTVGSAIKKSVVYKFTVYESLGANGEYPSPGQTWQEGIEDDIEGLRTDVNADHDELIDIREGADGVTYPSAGDAVRGQITDVKADLVQKLYTKTIENGFLSDLSNAIAWEAGVYDSSTGSASSPTSATGRKRIRTSSYIPSTVKEIIVDTSIYASALMYIYKYDSVGAYVGYDTITYNYSDFDFSTYQYKLAGVRDTDADVNKSALAYHIYSEPFEYINSLAAENGFINDISYQNQWEIGSINSDTGGNSTSTKRIRTKGFISPNTMRIVADVAKYASAGFYIYIYNSDGTYNTYHSSIYTSYSGFNHSKYKYRIVCVMPDGGSVTYCKYYRFFANQLDKKLHYENNLTTEGIATLPECNIKVNGVASDANYGVPNAVYEIKIPEYKKLHVFFEYMQTGDIPYVDADESRIASIFTAASGNINAGLWEYAVTAGSARFYRMRYFGLYTPSVNRQQIGARFNGSNEGYAFTVQYTGDPTVSANQDINLKFTSSAVQVIHHPSGTVIGSVSYSADDSVDTLIAGLNQIANITAKSVCTAGHTCGELLFIGSGRVQLVQSFTVDEQTKYDNPVIAIPYKYCPKWHTFECVIDEEANKAYVAFDGYTFEQNLSADDYMQYGKIIRIGGTYKFGSAYSGNTPIKVRNLVIDVDSFGDAEIITSVAPPYVTGLTQLISSHNPRLLIYEGHGIDVGADADGIVSDDMAISTDRLNVLFDTLANRGYIPVTWNQIIDWKVNGKTLPKRCFSIMFDDWRFENYVNYQKRIPFIQHNVKAGLAVISNQNQLTDTVTIDGVTYTVAQIVDMTMKAGWYPCSHTADHRNNNNYVPTELDALVKEDVLSCNALGIYADVLVYPYGYNPTWLEPILRLSGFGIGVDIVNNSYNCKAISDFDLTRVECGKRVTLEETLLPIV